MTLYILDMRKSFSLVFLWRLRGRHVVFIDTKVLAVIFVLYPGISFDVALHLFYHAIVDYKS